MFQSQDWSRDNNHGLHDALLDLAFNYQTNVIVSSSGYFYATQWVTSLFDVDFRCANSLSET